MSCPNIGHSVRFLYVYGYKVHCIRRVYNHSPSIALTDSSNFHLQMRMVSNSKLYFAIQFNYANLVFSILMITFAYS